MVKAVLDHNAFKRLPGPLNVRGRTTAKTIERGELVHMGLEDHITRRVGSHGFR